jgi:Reverse transcriptase (RNA-dependent DNA polymerase)
VHHRLLHEVSMTTKAKSCLELLCPIFVLLKRTNLVGITFLSDGSASSTNLNVPRSISSISSAQKALVIFSLTRRRCVRPPNILADRFGSNIMKPNKALYGLKQTPLCWNLYLGKMFDTAKVIKPPIPCLYAHSNCTIVVYVDDMIISGPSVEEVTELKNIIKGLFVCTDAGAMKENLGVLFERRDDGTFVLSQRQCLLNVLQRFGMEDFKPCATPCMPNKTIDEASTDMSYTTFPFREAVGSLLYFATLTRPDISFTAGMLGRAMAAPSAQDVVAVKRQMRYLSGTRDYGLVLSGTGESTLSAYSDADWGGDVDRKSTSGALHYFSKDLVHWTSKKQSCVALPTAQAEYVAA